MDDADSTALPARHQNHAMLNEPMRKAFAVVLPIVLASCRDPRAEANIAQAMMDVGTTISTMQQDYAMLQSEVDSLRQIVARQDTTIIRLASFVGFPLPPR
jgi:hypothetical protein